MKKWAYILLFSLPILVACSYLPKRRKRTREERTRDSRQQYDRDTNRIKGKDAPGQLF